MKLMLGDSLPSILLFVRYTYGYVMKRGSIKTYETGAPIPFGQTVINFVYVLYFPLFLLNLSGTTICFLKLKVKLSLSE